RWSIVPFLLVATFVLNGFLLNITSHSIYNVLFTTQLLFYSLALLGLILEKKEIRFKIAFVPYYFCMMNYSAVAGIFKYGRKEQSAVWDKVQRKESIERSILTLDQD